MTPPILQSYESESYGLYTVRRGDLQEWKSITVTNIAAYTEDVHFPISGVRVDEVLVKQGDNVKAGDVLVTLERAGILNEIEDLEKMLEFSQRTRANMKEMQVLDEREAVIRGNLSDVQAQYALDYKSMDAEELKLTLSLTDARRRLNDRVIVAGIDGVVTTLRNMDNRTVSAAAERFAVISDQTNALFVASGATAVYFNIGDRVEITVMGEAMHATVVDPVAMNLKNMKEDAAYFRLDADSPGLVTGSAGTLQVLLDERLDTILVPAAAVRIVGEESYVFMLENDFRVTRAVELGMKTAKEYEILSGLEVGEEIISGGVR